MPPMAGQSFNYMANHAVMYRRKSLLKAIFTGEMIFLKVLLLASMLRINMKSSCQVNASIGIFTVLPVVNCCFTSPLPRKEVE